MIRSNSSHQMEVWKIKERKENRTENKEKML